jgi:DNA (cytosine-5)-methyltransferase 1
MNVLSLCSGIAGLDLGIKAAFPEARTVCYVEAEPYCQRVLLARMADGLIDSAPIWGDLREFDGRPWRGAVDAVAGGFPCQPVSKAGKHLGDKDERWLWPDFRRAIREVGPQHVLLENVPGLLGRGFGDVLRDLAEMGFNAEWGVLPARAVGAPHLRERVFVLGHAYCDGLERRQQERPAQRSAPASARWCPEPDVARVDDGTPARVERIVALGNAVVPLQAAMAYRLLAERI